MEKGRIKKGYDALYFNDRHFQSFGHRFAVLRVKPFGLWNYSISSLLFDVFGNSSFDRKDDTGLAALRVLFERDLLYFRAFNIAFNTVAIAKLFLFRFRCKPDETVRDVW